VCDEYMQAFLLGDIDTVGTGLFFKMAHEMVEKLVQLKLIFLFDRHRGVFYSKRLNINLYFLFQNLARHLFSDPI
jgi:hypothetical protein